MQKENTLHQAEFATNSQRSVGPSRSRHVLADSAEEADDVGIPNHLATVVSHRPHKLKEPHGRICRAGKGSKSSALDSRQRRRPGGSSCSSHHALFHPSA